MTTVTLPGFTVQSDIAGEVRNFIVQDQGDSFDDLGLVIAESDMGVELYTFTKWPEESLPEEPMADVEVDGYGHIYLMEVFNLSGENTLDNIISVLNHLK